MVFELPRIYPLTDVSIAGMSHAEQVLQLINGGASLIQLREKEMSTADFFKDAQTALTIAHARGVRILINDRVDVALALGADGVHIGQDDLPPHAARRLLGKEAAIGFSTHSVDQAARALKLPVDYLAIGPIFQTSSKRDTSPVVGVEGLRAVRKVAGQIPIVAIGGITPENAPQVLAAGADSVALISALLATADDLSHRFRLLMNALSSSH